MNLIEIPFTKLTGAGNDFVGVNNLDARFAIDWSDFARASCERHYGVGADGLVVLGPSSSADYTMHYYNSDGSYGGMCGNGGRCSVLFAWACGIQKPSMAFEALGYRYESVFTNDGIRVAMKDPENIRRGILVETTVGKFLCHAVNTGSPHVVTFVEDLDSVDVPCAGHEIRAHAAFQPEGANVNFVCVLRRDLIAIRTYERGVEAETMACGTGSIASAVIAAVEGKVESPVSVQARSGEILKVGFQRTGDTVTHVSLEGKARIVFSSKVLYDATYGRIEGQSGL